MALRVAAAGSLLRAAVRAARPGCRARSTRRATAEPQALPVWMLAFPAAAAGLGTWQIFRKQQKEDLINHLTGQLSARPEPLPSSFDDLEALEYRRFELNGTFEHDKEVLIKPRTLTREAFDGQASDVGAQVITPMTLQNGMRVLVNRGWVPAKNENPATRAAGQVEGVQHVSGIFRLGEKKSTFVPANAPQKGQWYWIDIVGLAEHLKTAPILLDLAADSVPPGKLPVPGQTRINIRNTHLEYIITWYSLSLATAAWWFLARRRRAAWRAAAAQPAAAR